MLTPNYEKEFRREKIIRVWISFLIILIIAAATGLVFMLPSYFVLVLSKDDILRRLQAEEKVFEKKEFKSLEKTIAALNTTIFTFEKNEKKRHDLAPLLNKIAINTVSGISLVSITLSKNEQGSFTFSVVGEANARDDLLKYIDRLRVVQEFSSVNSPVANLLKENKASFVLDIKINPEAYKYESVK
ncbi:MAG: hypothetical protein UW57_C0013G0003 [Candidatus Giovannonibacteria bacterium GW2011_GWA1_44_29]|uniref:Fimbrial assembly family protein n=1 Tax=Candidatus Giovannonibacteria bacterium GW2011_GWA1_44_29 TaxID=1618646 RepID=A0A0G1ITR1_9BACT|nr:MAG: hypothetical protein UW57_C0013G0003 [Candidatus Giovannonibacteria bacterium GW2011_GWA1_44_29]